MSRLNDKVSVIIPVTRPHKIHAVEESVYANAGIPLSQFEIIYIEDLDRIGCPKMIKHLVSKTQYDLVMFFMDDAFAEQDLIKNALIGMGDLLDEWGMIGFNDHFHLEEGVATAWIADKKLLEHLGGEFAHTGYRHCFWDNELVDRCREMGKYRWLKEASFIHDHPILKGVLPSQQDDEVYKLVYRPDVYYHDMRLYKRRKANGWKK